MRLIRSAKALPVIASAAILLAACGSNGNGEAPVAQQPAAPESAAAAPATVPGSAGAQTSSQAENAAKSTGAAAAPAAAAPATDSAAAAPAPAAAGSAPAAATPADASGKAAKSQAPKAVPAPKAAPKVAKPAAGSAEARTKIKVTETAADVAANQKIYEQKNGATDTGITKESIKLGSINMHGMALGNVLTAPQVRGNAAAASAINDRGGVLGRRIDIVDCDDGPGEVARAKACIKKLAGQDKIFSLITGVDWATASIHDDLKQYKLPYLGAWAYSQTEWQDPYMFPTHMSMIHEAMANGQWVKNVIKPKTYGLVCLTSPEMQLACDAVKDVLNATGAKLVKKVDVGISETSMSAQILSLRAAAPDHIVHYVINPATMAKFMVEAAQQNYYPPQGISGNHLAAEVLGSLFGSHPVDRYWTNTTYKLWGPEFMATMMKYARGNRGTNHHIVQAGYVAVNMLAQAAKAVGPNLTKERLMTTLANGTVWHADASLDQKFQYTAAERGTSGWSSENGQGREFMYKYTSTNTVSNPNGSPAGFAPDDKQFVIYTGK
jgi:hypothetical protein